MMKQREIALMKQPLDLKLLLPGSKSITNRALLCAALAKGSTKLSGVLESDDTQVMMESLLKVGVEIEKKEGHWLIKGVAGQFKKGAAKFDLHNAGTATRFLTAAMVIREGSTEITGNERMQERPIGDLVDGLRQLGANVEYLGKEGYPPLRVEKAPLPMNNDQPYLVKMKGDKSSQYFSALLMVAPLLGRLVRIEVVGELVSKPYIDTTLAVMKAFGVEVENRNYEVFEIEPQSYVATDYEIEGDASAATYFSALNFLHGGALEFENLDYQNSIQGDVDFPEALKQLNKPSPRIIDMEAMPDAAMTLAVAAAMSPGTTTITGLSTLRIKETDRLQALKNELSKFGFKVEITEDSIQIEGKEQVTRKEPEVFVETYNDHRMAMCFAVLGTLLPGVQIENPACTDKTYPHFWEDLEKAYLSPLNLGDKHLVLIGMRCAGKTRLGKRLAKVLGRPFLDLDEAIEQEQGSSIWEMVLEKGWGYFREVEQNFCSRFAIEEKYSKEPLIVSTGGGCVLNEENMQNLKANAVTLLVYGEPWVLADRVMAKTDRPPLKEGQEPHEEIHKLWEERRPLYYQYADLVWDNTSGQQVESWVQNIKV